MPHGKEILPSSAGEEMEITSSEEDTIPEENEYEKMRRERIASNNIFLEPVKAAAKAL